MSTIPTIPANCTVSYDSSKYIKTTHDIRYFFVNLEITTELSVPCLAEPVTVTVQNGNDYCYSDMMAPSNKFDFYSSEDSLFDSVAEVYEAEDIDQDWCDDENATNEKAYSLADYQEAFTVYRKFLDQCNAYVGTLESQLDDQLDNDKHCYAIITTDCYAKYARQFGSEEQRDSYADQHAPFEHTEECDTEDAYLHCCPDQSNFVIHPDGLEVGANQ